jgi:hypothetical protein
MNFQEIVGALINWVRITTDPVEIDLLSASGSAVQYISRRQAQRRMTEGDCGDWRKLAEGPTLFVLDQGTRFKRQSSSSSPTIVEDANRDSIDT